jgi:hypothetical protein
MVLGVNFVHRVGGHLAYVSGSVQSPLVGLHRRCCASELRMSPETKCH